MPKKTTRDSELIREGCRSYHKALFAVMEFRRQVQATIRAAVKERYEKLAAGLGLDESLMETFNYADPANYQQNYDGSWAEVGLYMPKKWYQGDWAIWYFVWVGDDEAPLFGAKLWLKRPDPTIGKLKSLGFEVEEDSAGVYEPLPTDRAHDLTPVCNRVLDRWIVLWEQAGGLQQFLPKGKAKAAKKH